MTRQLLLHLLLFLQLLLIHIAIGRAWLTYAVDICIIVSIIGIIVILIIRMRII